MTVFYAVFYHLFAHIDIRTPNNASFLDILHEMQKGGEELYGKKTKIVKKMIDYCI